LNFFSLIEEAGNVLPTWELQLNSLDEKAIQLLNEKNPLTVTMGFDQQVQATSELIPVSMGTMDISDDERVMVVKGVLNAPGYSANSKYLLSEKKSALEVMEETASEFFDTDLDPNKSEDEQVWIRPYTSAKRFVNELWVRGDLPGSTPMIGISADGTFVVRSLSKVKIGKKWTFVNNLEGDFNTIPYMDNPLLNFDTGFLNAWFGYGREVRERDLDTDILQIIQEEIQVQQTISSELIRNPDVGLRRDHISFLSENVHANYNRARLRNLAYLTTQSMANLEIKVRDLFRDFRVLDPVEVQVPDQEEPQQSSEFLSGKYIITKVARNLSANSLTTILKLSRETVNN